MAKYLVKVSYNTDNIKDLLKQGASGRKKTVEELIAPMGGKMESFYYTFGDYAVFCISDIPDDISATALTTTLDRSGLITCSTTVLISPDDIDMAKNKVAHCSETGSL